MWNQTSRSTLISTCCVTRKHFNLVNMKNTGTVIGENSHNKDTVTGTISGILYLLMTKYNRMQSLITCFTAQQNHYPPGNHMLATFENVLYPGHNHRC